MHELALNALIHNPLVLIDRSHIMWHWSPTRSCKYHSFWWTLRSMPRLILKIWPSILTTNRMQAFSNLSNFWNIQHFQFCFFFPFCKTSLDWWYKFEVGINLICKLLFEYPMVAFVIESYFSSIPLSSCKLIYIRNY